MPTTRGRPTRRDGARVCRFWDTFSIPYNGADDFELWNFYPISAYHVIYLAQLAFKIACRRFLLWQHSLQLRTSHCWMTKHSATWAGDRSSLLKDKMWPSIFHLLKAQHTLTETWSYIYYWGCNYWSGYVANRRSWSSSDAFCERQKKYQIQ